MKLSKILVVFAYVGCTLAKEIEILAEWKCIDYDWESEAQRAKAVASLWYSKEFIWPDDARVLPDGRIFLTTPRPLLFAPASLSTVTNKTGPCGRLLAPYPSWKWHCTNDCSCLIDILRIFIDDCNRLWAVDTGKTKGRQVCPARIVAFDLTTNELVYNLRIPQKLFSLPFGLLSLQVVETSESCSKVLIVIADFSRYALLVSDGEDIWRLEDSELFSPTLRGSIITIARDTIILPFGVGGSLLSPPGFLNEKFFFFRPVSSHVYRAVSLSHLANSKHGGNITWYESTAKSESQELGRGISSTGIIMTTYGTETELACAHVYGKSPYVDTKLDENKTIYQFASASYCIDDIATGEVNCYLLTNCLQKFALRTMNFRETNFRIVMIRNVHELVHGTACEPVKPMGKHIIEVMSYKYYKTTTHADYSPKLPVPI